MENSQSLLTCTGHYGLQTPAAIVLSVLILYAVLTNSLLVYLLATKVELHPMAKVFSLFERLFILTQCILIEVPKAVFYYTSCLPNLELIIPQSLAKDSLVLNVPIPCDQSKLNGTCCDYILLHQPISSYIFEKTGIFLNISALVFYRMACLLRFYLIVVRPVPAHQETFPKFSQIIKYCIMGILFSGLLFALMLEDQFAFSRAYMAPEVGNPEMGLHGKLWYSLVFLADIIILILYIVIIAKVLKIPVASSMFHQGSFLSEAGCLLSPFIIAVGQLVFTLLFVLMRPIFLKFLFFGKDEKYTNMSQAVVFSFYIEFVYGTIAVLVIWTSHEYSKACKSVLISVLNGNRNGRPIIVVTQSRRDRALTQAKLATEWRKEQTCAHQHNPVAKAKPQTALHITSRLRIRQQLLECRNNGVSASTSRANQIENESNRLQVPVSPMPRMITVTALDKAPSLDPKTATLPSSHQKEKQSEILRCCNSITKLKLMDRVDDPVNLMESFKSTSDKALAMNHTYTREIGQLSRCKTPIITSSTPNNHNPF